VKLLLDTHAALWLLSADERLSENAERQLTTAIPSTGC
jgi:PIN domain nuclease of toxin-antitoxin system